MSNPEPTNTEVLAAVHKLAGSVNTHFDRVEKELTELRVGMHQLRGEVAGLKVSVSYCERYLADHHAALLQHLTDPNAHRPAA